MFKPRQEITAADRAYNVRMNPVNQELWCKKIRAEGWSRMNAWQQNFVDNVERWIYSERGLSEKQAEKLEEIYAEVTR